MSASDSRLTSEEIQKQWDDLTPLEVDWINGDTGRLVDALVTKYGLSRDEAARQVVAYEEEHSRKNGP